MKIEELDTPAVIVDLDILETNLQSLASYCRKHGIGLRPHTKTHKIPAIAKMQIESGCHGITVAKVSEAEVMANAGLNDILIAYPLWGATKLERLTKLAQDRKITVSLDSLPVAQGISEAANRAGCRVSLLSGFMWVCLAPAFSQLTTDSSSHRPWTACQVSISLDSCSIQDTSGTCRRIRDQRSSGSARRLKKSSQSSKSTK